MALHTELPIYKVAYDLLGLVVELVKHMPRDFKASIGSAIRDECVKVTVLVFRANVSTAKAPHLLELIERVQVAELLLRLARDKRWISITQYAKAVQLTQSVSRQANGWRKNASPVA